MKIHLRFFLSHDKMPKISIFYQISVYFEEILHENRREMSWFKQRHNAPFYDLTGKHT